MAVYSASTLTVIVISEPSMVIGLWLFGLRMACRFSDEISGLVVIEPGETLLESVIMLSSWQGVDTSVVVGLGRDAVVVGLGRDAVVVGLGTDVVVPSVAVVVPNDDSIENLY